MSPSHLRGGEERLESRDEKGARKVMMRPRRGEDQEDEKDVKAKRRGEDERRRRKPRRKERENEMRRRMTRIARRGGEDKKRG